MNADLLAKAKSYGFSDRQIAFLTGHSEDAVRAERKRLNLVPGFRLVDTCAAEFEAYTPYYYSTYDRGDDEVRPSDKKKVMILGGGPNRIGQGIEFDYCCVHAAFALKEDGFETLMVNSNPETVSTDYDTSDKLFFEPLTLEDVLHIYERERCWGAIAQFGGQTPLNLALGLQKNGVNIIGTSPQSIEIAEDRKLFAAMLRQLDGERLRFVRCNPVGRLRDVELAQHRGEQLAVFGDFDALGRGADDVDPVPLQAQSEVERRLPAELR